MIKLIVTDIDDTIMPKGARVVSPRTLAALHAAMDAGIRVGPVSGRGLAQMLPFFGGDESCVQTGVGSNGSQVFLDGESLLEGSFDPALLQSVIDLVKGMPGVGVLCFDGATPILLAGKREDLAHSFPAYAEVLVTDAGKPVPIPDTRIIKANVFVNGDTAATQEVVDLINAQVAGVDADVALPGFSNLMPAGVNKAAAIKVLVDALGIGLDEVVAFGDGGNDLSMLRAVPNGVAVANAVPEVAAAARWHIGPCSEESVAAAIESLAAGEWPFTE